MSVLILLFLNACKKEYICVCTEKSTGDKNYGDHFKASGLTKKVAEESCRANDDVFNSDLKDCHLE